MRAQPPPVVRFTAWSGIIGGVIAYLSLIFVGMVVGDDVNATLHGATMLALSSDARSYMRLSMISDVCGFYLPVLVIAGYLWHRYRDEAGALGDMAMLAIVVYAGVGISGASMLLATLDPLVRLHAGGDEIVRAATESAWTVISYACQKGLWWAEGPLVLFWGLVTGSQLKKDGWGRWSRLPLTIAGWCYFLFSVFAAIPGLGDVAESIGTVAVLVFPFWMMLFGGLLLRGRSVAAA